MNKTQLKNFVDAGYKKKSDAQNINGYILDPELSTKRDKIYYDPNTGKAVHTIAGTDSAYDWTNNALIPLGLHEYTNRYKNSERIQKDANNKYGINNVDLVSHSQSGNIAENLANKNLVGGLNTTLNPAIIGNHNKDITVYKSIIDPVSFLTNTTNKDYHIIPKTFNPITEHGTDILNKTKNIFGFGINTKYTIKHIKNDIKRNKDNKLMKYRSEDDSEASSSEEEEEYELKGGALHEQDIIDRMAKLSHDIHVHHKLHGIKPSIVKGFKILGHGIVQSAVVRPEKPSMSGGKVNRNKKFNTWFKDIGQKFLPLNKNLSPIKHQATQSAVDQIAYNTMTPEQQAQSGVDMFEDLFNTDNPKPVETTPTKDTYNALYQPVVAQPVTQSAYHGYYDSAPVYQHDPYDFNSQPSSYNRSYQPSSGMSGFGLSRTQVSNIQTGVSGAEDAGFDPHMEDSVDSPKQKGPLKGFGFRGRGATGSMLKKSAAAAVVRLLNSGTDRATHEMSTRGKKGVGLRNQSNPGMSIQGSGRSRGRPRGCGATGTMLKNTAAGATANLINAGSNRAASEMTTQGTGFRGRGATGTMLKNTAAGATANLINAGSDRAANEMTTQGTGFKGRGRPRGCGATGTMLKNTAAGATANLINAGSDRAANEMTTQGTGIKAGRFKKGSQAAKDHMARIRAMKR